MPNSQRSLEPRRRNRVITTKVVSGIPVWPSRDPIKERGGINLYGFVRNNGIRWIDILGLSEVSSTEDCYPVNWLLFYGHAGEAERDDEPDTGLEAFADFLDSCSNDDRAAFHTCGGDWLNRNLPGSGVIPGTEVGSEDAFSPEHHELFREGLPPGIFPPVYPEELTYDYSGSTDLAFELERVLKEAVDECAKNKCACKVVVQVRCGKGVKDTWDADERTGGLEALRRQGINIPKENPCGKDYEVPCDNCDCPD